MKKSFLVFLFFSILYSVNAQHQQVDTVIFAGKKMLRVITERGDTAYLDQLDEVSVSSKKQFGSKDEYDRYMRYRRYAAIVYPYALEARELEEQFEEPLKKLTRTQGLILTKMIEKELNEPFYDVIKEIKGTWSAFYYNTSGRFYGYHLRDGYKRGEDYILDMVLDDYRLNIKR